MEDADTIIVSLNKENSRIVELKQFRNKVTGTFKAIDNHGNICNYEFSDLIEKDSNWKMERFKKGNISIKYKYKRNGWHLGRLFKQ